MKKNCPDAGRDLAESEGDVFGRLLFILSVVTVL